MPRTVEPHMGTLSAMKGSIQGEYEDILEERRQSSDLRFGIKNFTPVIYKDLTPCKSSVLKTMAMDSDELQYVMKQISLESDEPLEIIQEQASEILDGMGHNFKLCAIRFLSFNLSKIFKRLYKKIYVNVEGLQRLAKAIQEHPVVLLPTHQSYIDFLLVSYIMYTYELAIPVIAAGEDLGHMKFIGQLLRLSGAFYIKRSFRGNELYSAVFAAYVKNMIRMGFAPLEFFIEGQRSRTGKALHPKLGLLNVVLEPFFKSQVFDTYLIPISISYERILEEAFHVQELLGAPKSKESTSGLLRARKLLNDNYGNIYIHFGQPMSVQSLASGKIDRSQFNLTPRHLPYHPPKDIQNFVTDVGYKVELCQIANIVISPGMLIAAILLQDLPAVNYNILVEKALWLKDLTETFGGRVNWPDNIPVDEVMRSSLDLHSNFIILLADQVVLLEHNGNEIITEELVFKRAVTFLMASYYRNQIVNIFKQSALVVLACKMAQSFKTEAVNEMFKFLRCVLFKEFIFVPNYEEQDFEEGCSLLRKNNFVQMTSDEIMLVDTSVTLFLCNLVHPFLEGYQLACKYLIQDGTEIFTEKQFTSGIQNFASRYIAAGVTSCYTALSIDLLKNSLATFVQLGVVEARISSSEKFFAADRKAAKDMATKLEVHLGKFPTARL